MKERYVIHVTKKCNCNCLYCYEKDKMSTYTWEEVKELIDGIVKYNKSFGVEFLGGEPAMAFHLIQQSYEYLESMNDIFVSDYVITTNSTILTEEMLDFLKTNKKVYWSASLDGTKYMNQLRVFKEPSNNGAPQNTYDVVVDNLKKLLYNIDIDRIHVHMTTHPYNVAFIDRGVGHLYSLGIRHIGIGTVESTIKIGREYAEDFISQLDIVSKKIINGTYQNLKIDLFEWIKPKEDKRSYLFNSEGKLIGESYGRVENDIVSNSNYKTVLGTSPLQNMIYEIREYVHLRHKENLNEKRIR